MMVRARDDIYRMKELKGKKIGLSKSLNTIKNDWWRIQEHMGIELMLRVERHDHGRRVEIVEFPYPDDWYDKPEMLDPMDNASELWLKRDHKRDLAFRPLETALEKGLVDAIYTQSKVFQQLQEANGQVQSDRGPVPLPGLDPAGGQHPAVITCTDVMAESTRTRGHLHEGHDQGRPLGQRAQACRRGDPRQADVLPGRGGHLPGHQAVDMVPNLSPQNLASVEIGKDFMLSHGYIKNDFDVNEWAAPRFLEQAARELLEDEWQKRRSSFLSAIRRWRGWSPWPPKAMFGMRTRANSPCSLYQTLWHGSARSPRRMPPSWLPAAPGVGVPWPATCSARPVSPKFTTSSMAWKVMGTATPKACHEAAGSTPVARGRRRPPPNGWSFRTNLNPTPFSGSP
jgi:hypothetical protein